MACAAPRRRVPAKHSPPSADAASTPATSAAQRSWTTLASLGLAQDCGGEVSPTSKRRRLCKLGTAAEEESCPESPETPPPAPRDSSRLASVRAASAPAAPLAPLPAAAPETTELIGRESERAALGAFVASCFQSSPATAVTAASRSIYLSGGPGTGKTCCAKEAIARQMEAMPTLRYVEVNCMRLAKKTISGLLTHISEQLVGRELAQELRDRPGHVAAAILAKYLAALGAPVLLLVDEVDQLVKRDSADAASALQSLFALPHAPGVPEMALIAIANAVDLLERPGAVAVRGYATSLLFEVYSVDQLRAIFVARLRSADVGSAVEQSLGRVGVEIRVRQVAKASGDCRQLLSLCRQAILDEATKNEKDNSPALTPETQASARSSPTPATSRIDALVGGYLPIDQQVLLSALVRAQAQALRFDDVFTRYKEMGRLLRQDMNLACKGTLATSLTALRERGLLASRSAGRGRPRQGAWGDQIVELAVTKKALRESLTRTNPMLEQYLQE